jgi:restriction system protein
MGLITNVKRSPASNALDGMSWQEFEMMVGEGFRLQGYKLLKQVGVAANGSINLVLSAR